MHNLVTKSPGEAGVPLGNLEAGAIFIRGSGHCLAIRGITLSSFDIPYIYLHSGSGGILSPHAKVTPLQRGTVVHITVGGDPS